MNLPNYIKDFFNKRKITDKVLEDFNISFDGERIVIPVADVNGKHMFSKYRRSPLSDQGPKYTYDVGGKVSLYGCHLTKEHDTILCVEGEFDCLVAWSHNIPSVTSTGGALSFQKEWVDCFINEKEPPETDGKDVIFCFDNDLAGAEGMVKALSVVPWAKVMLIPDMPNVKDISDYVNMGGDLHELLKTARHFGSIEEVAQDRSRRIATFRSTLFHDAYIKAHTKVAPIYTERKSFSSDRVTNAKQYPITNLMQFTANKACCPFHREKTPSFHYYPKTNSCYCFGGCGKAYDSIAIYMKLNNCSFKEAVNELNK